MFTTLIAIFAVLAVAYADVGTWVIDTDNQSTTCVGCGAGDATHGIAAAAQNGEGAIVDLFDGNDWTRERNAVNAGLLMDGAISADGQTAALVSMFTIFLSTDGAKTFTGLSGFGGVSQDVHVTSDVIAAIGNFIIGPNHPDNMTPGTASGVAVSTDNGSEWDVIQVSDETMCRYGSFPTADTWYVSAGIWNTTEATFSVKQGSENHRASHRVHIGPDSHNAVKFNGGLGDSTTGWYGKIYKTTDAGKTWSNVFTSPDDAMYYFNEISCSDENTCIAVAEGYNSDMTAPYAGTYMTTDGGANWKVVWESNNYQGLMAAHMVSNTEGWFAAIPMQRAIATDFYHTTDGGATWDMVQQLSGCYALDMDMADTLGIATCMNSSGTAMMTAHYEA
jgi:hypothetical protein